jgi:hypothetical protein
MIAAKTVTDRAQRRWEEKAMKGVMHHGFVRFPVRLISLASIALTKISVERVTFRRIGPDLYGPAGET